jgi:hypothetical protein
MSGGNCITGGVQVALALRDRPVRISQDDYIPRLKWISKKFVVFWDEGEKRGWLINGISALLHLTRASLEADRTDEFNSVFQFKPEDMEESTTPHASNSAIHVLLSNKNMKLPIYPRKGEMYDEGTFKHSTSAGFNAGPQSAIIVQSEWESKTKNGFIRFEDRVEHIYNILEKLIDHQANIASKDGVNIKPRIRKHLEGWDFIDVATDRDPFYPRVATLDTIGKGWVDFTRDIQAVTLFGRGFGDIIRPTTASASCKYWHTLPRGKYYLAASVLDLRKIMTLYGDQDAEPMQLCRDGAVWYNPGEMFNPCKCKRGTGLRDHSDFAQVPLPSSNWFSMVFRKTIKPGPLNPILLKDAGAVVFGHNRNLKLRWNDLGDPVEADLPIPCAQSEESQVEPLAPLDHSASSSQSPFVDSGMGSSTRSPAMEDSNSPLSTSERSYIEVSTGLQPGHIISDSPNLEERTPSITLPNRAALKRLRPDDDELQGADEVQESSNPVTRQNLSKSFKRRLFGSKSNEI